MPYSIQEIRKFLEIIGKNKETILKPLPVICVIIGTYFLLNSIEVGQQIFGGILLTIGLFRLLEK